MDRTKGSNPCKKPVVHENRFLINRIHQLKIRFRGRCQKKVNKGDVSASGRLAGLHTRRRTTVPKISGGPNTGIKHGKNLHRLGETRVKSGSTFCREPKTLGVACYHYPHSSLRPGALCENVSGPVLSSDWSVLVQGPPDSGLHLHRKTLYPINYKLLFKSDHTFGHSSFSIKTGPSNDGPECSVKTGDSQR